MLQGACAASDPTASLIYIVAGTAALYAVCPAPGFTVPVSVKPQDPARPDCPYNATLAFNLTSERAPRGAWLFVHALRVVHALLLAEPSLLINTMLTTSPPRPCPISRRSYSCLLPHGPGCGVLIHPGMRRPWGCGGAIRQLYGVWWGLLTRRHAAVRGQRPAGVVRHLPCVWLQRQRERAGPVPGLPDVPVQRDVWLHAKQ